jgi:hypothetical protein
MAVHPALVRALVVTALLAVTPYALNTYMSKLPAVGVDPHAGAAPVAVAVVIEAPFECSSDTSDTGSTPY